ncbi:MULTISPECIES: MFS transporter [Actinosynnema]|uniref:MFS transporter n=1 Tax=Actinosynnema TaxID=40566 RepID=UPI0020A5E235|nr:MFS transporter [Actinosynnema pretiosum]MCP2097567.1 putative arabinose efflux permease, MFS family [Actinosynnema pretiosum]
MNPLREGPFLRLWSGQTIAELGYHLSLVALPLVAVLQLGATPAQMGLIVGVGMAPFAFAWPFFGVLVDRVDRRRLLQITYVGRAVLLGSLPVAALLGSLGVAQLVAVQFLVSLLHVAFSVVHPSLLPSVVPAEHLVAANSRVEMTRSGAMIIGPSAAGFLVELLSPANTVAIDAVCYVVAAALLAGLALPSKPEVARPAGTVWHDIREGFSSVFGDPVLRPMAISSGIMNAFFYIRTPLVPLFVLTELGGSAGQLGLVLAAAGPGALVGSALARRVNERYGLSRAVTGAAFLAGVPVLAVPLVPDSGAWSIGVLVVSAFAVGVGVQVYSISLVSARQLMTPDHLLGRVNATFRWTAWAATPFSALLSGLLAQVVGLRGAIAVAAAGLLLPGLFLLFSAVRRTAITAEGGRA